ncbi:MAG: DUF1761 domain-containing protein [Patescibacteria group bacterium]
MDTSAIWPVIVASIAAFVIGAIWYSPLLFGKEWMTLIGSTDKDIAEAKAKGMAKSYIAQLIATVITFTVMAFAISEVGAYSARDGAFVGLIAWVGFVVPGAMSSMLWEKRSLKFVLITSICALVSWIIGGSIIGGWY